MNSIWQEPALSVFLIVVIVYMVVGFVISTVCCVKDVDLGCFLYVFAFPALASLLVCTPIVYITTYLRHRREAKARGMSVKQLKWEYIKKQAAAEGDYPALQWLRDRHDPYERKTPALLSENRHKLNRP